MDGSFLAGAVRNSLLDDAQHAPQRRDLACTRPLLFLQRDLSEQALRQPDEPRFSRDEMSLAKQEGFDAGYAAALADAAASRAAAEVMALRAIAGAMTDAAAQAARVSDQAAAALGGALTHAMRAVVPELMRRSGLVEASAMLAQLLPGLSREPEVRVAVAPELADGLSASLAGFAPDLRERIQIAGSGQAGEADVSVRWHAGQARRQPAQVWSAVMETLEAALCGPAMKDDAQ